MERRFRSRVFWLVSLLLVGLSSVSVSAQSRRPKNVQVALRAKWPGTSLLLEAGELLSKQSNDLFWEFTDLWLQPDRGSDCLTARCCVQKFVDDGRSLLSEQSGSVFEFSLTLRTASPRLVLYRQLAEESLTSYPIDDGDMTNFAGDTSEPVADRSLMSKNPRSPGGSCCWLDIGSTLLFNVPDILLWLDTASGLHVDSSKQPEVFEFDHVYSDSSSAGAVAVLYGALGTECFREFHNVLTEESKKGKVRYIVRPVLPSGCQAVTSYCSAIGTAEAVNLGGYGVELALKNMEYKAMDDSAIKKGVTLEDPRTDDLSQEVRGFIFSKILDRKPELTSEIMAFRDYLLSSTISDTLEVWELKGIIIIFRSSNSAKNCARFRSLTVYAGN